MGIAQEKPRNIMPPMRVQDNMPLASTLRSLGAVSAVHYGCA